MPMEPQPEPSDNSVPTRRYRAWEIREKYKLKNRDVVPRRTTSTIDAPDISTGGKTKEKMTKSLHGPRACFSSARAELPPAFRALPKVGRKFVTPPRAPTSSMQSSAHSRLQSQSQRTARSKSIMIAMEKHLDDASTITPINEPSYSDDVSMGSFGTSTVVTLGSQPPERPQRSLSTTTKAITASFNLSASSMDISPEDLLSNDAGDQANNATSSDQSISQSQQLQRLAELPVPQQPVYTNTASDEQWARFKLLGRIGLGEINVSPSSKPLIERNVEILAKAIRHVAALRDDSSTVQSSITNSNHSNMSGSLNNSSNTLPLRTGHVLDEIKETIELPNTEASFRRDPNTVQLCDDVLKQLNDYVVVISSMYRNNAFHNFEHASHVLNGVNRLASLVDDTSKDNSFGCGVISDPWIHFALVFSALIHDVDHSGVPNAQLIKERSHVAGAYKNKSVAEQNSIELAWNLLMEPCYKNLRDFVFLSAAELGRFRGLVVTGVMATDIADKELAALRKGRAAEAMDVDMSELPTKATGDEVDLELVSRKRATFVLETLIQVADVSHTMGEFEVYKKWNHKLYKEMYRAFRTRRAEKDPTETWYKGDIGFFDFYIVPLAKKLKQCGITDSACEEYVQNAQSNRTRWEKEGEDIVAGYVRDMEKAAKEALNSSCQSMDLASIDDLSSPANTEKRKLKSQSMDVAGTSSSTVSSEGASSESDSESESDSDSENDSEDESSSSESESDSSDGDSDGDIVPKFELARRKKREDRRDHSAGRRRRPSKSHSKSQNRTKDRSQSTEGQMMNEPLVSIDSKAPVEKANVKDFSKGRPVVKKTSSSNSQDRRDKPPLKSTRSAEVNKVPKPSKLRSKTPPPKIPENASKNKTRRKIVYKAGAGVENLAYETVSLPSDLKRRSGSSISSGGTASTKSSAGSQSPNPARQTMRKLSKPVSSKMKSPSKQEKDSEEKPGSTSDEKKIKRKIRARSRSIDDESGQHTRKRSKSRSKQRPGKPPKE